MIPLFDDDGLFYDTDVPFLDDNMMFNKLKVLEYISKKEKISLDEMIHVGDGINDISAFEKCLGVSYNAQSKEVKDSANYNVEDLRELIPLLKKLK